MNVDEILGALNREQVDYLLIGGMNFLLRHKPELTFDVDVWVGDSDENLRRLNKCLHTLAAEWGRTEAEWGPVGADWKWLRTQSLFCLTTKHGALDVFREVRGLEGRYEECKSRAVATATAAGVIFRGLSDRDMLVCQQALPPESPAHGSVAGSHSQRATIMNQDSLKEREERKREAAYDPVKRWKAIQETITWAEANLPYHLRRNRPRVPKVLPPNPQQTS